MEHGLNEVQARAFVDSTQAQEDAHHGISLRQESHLRRLPVRRCWRRKFVSPRSAVEAPIHIVDIVAHELDFSPLLAIDPAEEALGDPKRARAGARRDTWIFDGTTWAGLTLSIDFVRDYLGDGQRLDTLNVLDALPRECHAIEVDTSLPSARVVRVLDRRVLLHDGPEFISMALDAWAHTHGVQLDFIQPRKPVQNVHVEPSMVAYATSVSPNRASRRWPTTAQRAPLFDAPRRIRASRTKISRARGAVWSVVREQWVNISRTPIGPIAIVTVERFEIGFIDQLRVVRGRGI